MSRDAPVSPAEDSLVGRVINDRYRVVAAVSRDHVGRVYRAEQLPLGRPVSIKVLDPRQRRRDEDAQSQLQQRFLIEASIAARLQHPNTVHVFDYGYTPDGLCFTTFELIEGRTLSAVLVEQKPFSAERVLHVALQMARSLREAHRVGIVHGSVKPASVLLTRHGDEDDFVKLCDYGTVRAGESDELEELTQQSMFTGAPKYMAPERIRGEHCDARADVYALGACMYEMLTGRVPFDRPGAVQLLMAHMQEAVPSIERFDCPPALSRLVMRCLAKAPVERPASMDDVIVLLKQAAGRSLHATMPILISRELALTPAALPTQHEATPAPALATQAQPLAAAAPSMVPERHPNAWLPKLAVIGAIMLAAGFLALRQRPVNAVRAGATQAGAAAASPRTEAALASRPTGPADAFRLRVRLSSLPSGAYVEVSGKRYGPTPADIELWGDAVKPGNELTFVFDKAGFERASVTRLVRGEELSLEVVLGRPGGSGERARPAQPVAEEAAPTTSYTQLEQWPALSDTPAAAPTPAPAPAPAPAQPAWKPIAEAAPAPAAKPAAPPSIAKHSTLVKDASQVFPDYPRAALRAGISGIVVARVYVKTDGRVGAVDVLDGPDVFHEAVRKALMTWRYTPARAADGSALPDTHIVRVPFQLK